MNTIVRVNKREVPFVQIHRSIFENKLMSWKAKGLMGYLLSRPDDWSINLRDLINRGPDGRDSVRSTMNELLKLGYVSVEKLRTEKGVFVCNRWTVHEAPLSTDGFSGAGLSGAGKPAPTNKDRKTDKKKPTHKDFEAASFQEVQTPEPQAISQTEDPWFPLEGPPSNRPTAYHHEEELPDTPF